MTSNIKIKKINNEVSSIIIDEPKTYNSLSFKNLSDLLKALKKLDADKKVKVIILDGAGKGFSAGHNLKEVKGLKKSCLLYTSPSPRDQRGYRMPSSA